MSEDPQPKLEAEETEAAPEADGDALEAAQAELAKTRDDLLRALAEVENTRRRAERQAQDARVYAIDRFARDLLPVADNMARALAAAPDGESLDEATRLVLTGVEMTEKALVDAFARHGMSRTGEKGEAFDPNRHQAVAQAPSDAPAGSIAEVVQAGYVLGERTLRPALVVVSAGPKNSSPPDGPAEHIDIKV